MIALVWRAGARCFENSIRKFGCAATAALVGLGLVVPSAAVANGEYVYEGHVQQLKVVVDKSRVIDVGETFGSALIAQADIADVVPLTDRSVYIIGKKLGATRLVVTDPEKAIIRILEIEVTPDIPSLRRKLAANLDMSRIKVTAANNGILLSGTARTAIEAKRAVMISERYAPKNVTNAIEIDSPQQVMLEVRFVEALRSSFREFGLGSQTRSNRFNLDTGRAAAVPATAGPLLTSALISGSAPFGTMIARVLDSGAKVDIILRALEERALIRRLAEPNLSTLSGNTASFLAGGEFPFPVGAEDNKIALEFKKFGVALKFTPTVLGDGQINLQIAPEVSEIDNTQTIVINNISVPGLTVRRADTTVELKDGQSLAIAGLLQNRHSKSQKQLPWIGQVPVLGALFRSASFQRQETDLVIIVTPRLVKPKVPGEKLVTPFDSHSPTNDPEFFIKGKAEVRRLAERRGFKQDYGHILELPTGEVAHVATK
ncbi:MAG: type II and III secretion system protein family protein [Pseudomonadota bacterium]